MFIPDPTQKNNKSPNGFSDYKIFGAKKMTKLGDLTVVVTQLRRLMTVQLFNRYGTWLQCGETVTISYGYGCSSGSKFSKVVVPVPTFDMLQSRFWFPI
jgi:hypothetical protein